MISELLTAIIQNNELHAKWLNTLSYLENCGAKKIARCQHPTKVKEEMLKHASEEFRHAYHLKCQIERLPVSPLNDYSLANILGGNATLRYLNALDLFTCRYLTCEIGLSKSELKHAAYLLVTYAIELRAAELYPLYDELLKNEKSKVRVKSILLEEEEHLDEMRKELQLLPSGEIFSHKVCLIENKIHHTWIKSVKNSML